MVSDRIISLIVLFSIAFIPLVYGTFLYLRAARKEKMLTINKSLTENDANVIEDKKDRGKACCLFGMIALIGIFLMILAASWILPDIIFFVGLAIFGLSIVLSFIAAFSGPDDVVIIG